MKKIEAIIRLSKFDEIKDELDRFGIHGMTVTSITGCGLQKGRKEIYRGKEYSLSLMDKIKIEIVVEEGHVQEIVDILIRTSRTGEVGDGKIFIYNVEDVIRIRTGERGKKAI